jgi:hypothetical protein
MSKYHRAILKVEKNKEEFIKKSAGSGSDENLS